MAQTTQVSLSLDQIEIDATFDFDIYDDAGVLLLRQNTAFSESLCERLKQRGVTNFYVDEEVAHRFQSADAKPVAKSERVVTTSAPLHERRVDRGSEAYSPERAARYSRQAAQAFKAISSIGTHISSLSAEEVNQLFDLPQAFAEMVIEDADQSLYTITQESQTSSLAKRCVNMSMLAINTGIELGLSDDDISKLGLAGLVHDIGLFQLAPVFQDCTKALSEDEAWDYRRHPTLTLETLAKFRTIPDEVGLIASHVHESPDGSGYPRGLTAKLIHPLAKVLSVIDVYLTLVFPGPGRPGIVPHDALHLLLLEGKENDFDPRVVRALITQLSLFPIGMKVELRGGVLATTVRRNVADYAHPYVRLESSDEILLADGETSIVRPHVSDDSEQMRISGGMEHCVSAADFDRWSRVAQVRSHRGQ